MKRISCIVLSLILIVLGFSSVFAGGGAQRGGTGSGTSSGPSKLTIYFNTAGQALPDNFDYYKDPFLLEICRLANVEFTDITVPVYADRDVRFNLLIASGNLPDIVHYGGAPALNAMANAGRDGAFLDLTDFASSSSIINSKYSREQINGMKSDDGKIYTIVSRPIADGWSGFATRWDLLQEVGYNALPTTLEGWVEAMKKVKDRYPSSLPYTTMGMDNYQHFLFTPFGLFDGIDWQYYKGQIVNSFAKPNLDKAILFGKQLLADGLLDREFVTNKQQDHGIKKTTRQSVVIPMNLGTTVTTLAMFRANGVMDAIMVMAPYPIVDDGTIDPYSYNTSPQFLARQCISVSARSRDPGAAKRFIEVLLSDEVNDLVVYGREGIEYKLQNNIKVPDAEKSTETAYRNIYGIMISYNPLESIRLRNEISIAAMVEKSEAERKAYNDVFFKYYDDLLKLRYDKVGPDPKVMILLSDTALARSQEAIALQKTLIMRALMDEITIDDLMSQAAELVRRYQDVTDEYNAKLPAVKQLIGIN